MYILNSDIQTLILYLRLRSALSAPLSSEQEDTPEYRQIFEVTACTLLDIPSYDKYVRELSHFEWKCEVTGGFR